MITNKLLWRQLKHCFGLAGPDDLRRLLAGPDTAGLACLLAKVGRSYDSHQRDLALRTRSLALCSQELRREIDAGRQALERLRQSAAALAGRDVPAPAETDTIESLSTLIGDLVDQRLRVEESLRAGERRFRDLTEMSSDWYWEQDAQLRFTEVSAGPLRNQVDPRIALGKTRAELPISAASEAEMRAHQETMDQRLPFDDFVCRVEIAPGQARWLSISGRPLFDPDGTFRGYRGTGCDITERKRSDDELRLAASVFQTTAEGVMVTDAEARILAVNPAFETITGYARAEAIGRTPHMLASGLHDAAFYHAMWAAIARDGHWQGEIWDRRKTGETYAAATSISAIKDEAGAVCKYVSVFSDVSEQKRAEERITFLAQHDFLTGLPNRVLMEDRLTQAIHLAERTGGSLALVFIDLDHFKNINDSLGHHVGDMVLQGVAERLRACVRKSDTVCRLGGDEFLVILGNMSNAEDAARIADKVLAALAEPCLVDQHHLYVTPSIGISLYPGDGTDAVSLMKNADAAMYHAKRHGRNLYQFFTQDLNARVSERLSLENSLREGLERGEFQLYYQPKVAIGDGAIVGVEALVRWRHAERGMVPPDHFIPVAEESGLIIPLGEWILRTACRQCRDWQRRGWMVPVAVNISPAQFDHDGFMASVARALAESGLAAASLELELTEGMVMRHGAESVAQLHGLAQLGVSLSIDDFGTGYSSLGYLKRFPLDRLKIDRSFVRDIASDQVDGEIVKAVITLAHALGLTVVAEGVETAGQRDRLRALGADECQGFFYQHPLPVEALEILLQRLAPATVP